MKPIPVEREGDSPAPSTCSSTHTPSHTPSHKQSLPLQPSLFETIQVEPESIDTNQVNTSQVNREGVKKTARKDNPRARSAVRVRLPAPSATHYLEDHMAAAQSLAKNMRRQRRPKRQRQKEGLAICAHLIAHLKSASVGSTNEAPLDSIKKVEQKPH